MARFAVGLSLVLLLGTSFSFAQNDPAAGIQLFLYALTNCARFYYCARFGRRARLQNS
jgi:hypothetical protein